MENTSNITHLYRDTVFISHATPSDNTFAAWLATKLELCGYKVWVDINNLSPSVDFWNTIEQTIRNHSSKFVFVISKDSINPAKDGVRKELAVADKVKQQFPGFIVPVRIDNTSFSDLPVEILRLNAIDFNDDWAEGLINLLKYFNDENVLKSIANKESSFYINRWTSSQSQSQFRSQITDGEEEYCSNIFHAELPHSIYIYRSFDVEQILRDRHIPIKINKGIVVTFACNECVSAWANKSIEYLSFDTMEAIEKQTTPGFFLGEKVANLSKDIIFLVNWSIGDMLVKHGLYRYKPESNKVARNVYFFPSGKKSKRFMGNRLKALSGVYKTTKRWHLGLSGYYTQYPTHGCIFNWHLVFTDGNGHLLPESSQIAARRSKGRLMFNKQWKELLDASMYYLSSGTSRIFYSACCENNALYILSQSERFISETSYTEPNNRMDTRESEEENE